MALACRVAALSSCSYSNAVTYNRSRPVAVHRRHAAVVRAQEGSGAPPPQQQGQADADGERRLEALEKAAKARKGIKAEQADAFRGTTRREQTTSRNGMPEWKEGKLFPEGWEEMEPFEKAVQLYMGQRGFLYWGVEAAKYSAGGLIVGWALFRFVGPALGLYRLADDITTVNFM